MKIAGLQKLSLLDYPENIACVVFTRGCNLRCPYCHNPELADPERYQGEDMPLEIFWKFLQSRKSFLDGVCITGGEPTLQPDLEEFTEGLRDMGYKVKLDTNGSQPEVLEKLLKKKLLDYVAMDVKVPLEKYKTVMGFNGDHTCIGTSIDILEGSSIEHEFRTTVVPGIHSSEDIEIIGNQLDGAELFFIQNFRPSKHIEPKMTEMKGFSRIMLDNFKDILEKHITNVYIRN